jgi:hypothetical protein
MDIYTSIALTRRVFSLMLICRGMPGFLHPLKFYFTPKIGPTSPPKYFLFCLSPVFFSSTALFFYECFPQQTRFHGKNPWPGIPKQIWLIYNVNIILQLICLGDTSIQCSFQWYTGWENAVQYMLFNDNANIFSLISPSVVIQHNTMSKRINKQRHSYKLCQHIQ